MKPSRISIALLVVSLLLAPALFAQSPDATNQNGVSPTPAAYAAEVPRLIKFSGALLDAQGRPQSGPVGVTFALYAQQTGGAALWLETQNVKPDENDNYTVLLGANSANGVPAELFVSGEARWLGIQVGQQPEHERILLVSVPYALKAGDAETLGGKPLSSFVLNEASTTGSSAGSAAVAPSSSAGKMQTTTGASMKTSATPQAVTPCSSVTSDGTATAGSISQFTAPCNIQSSLMTQTLVNGFPGVSLAGNNAGLLLNGTGTHQVTVTGATSGRLGQDANGFFFASDTKNASVRFLTNNGTLNEWMRITSAGNVGIHTQTPAATLDINGNLNLPNTASSAVGVISLGGVPFVHNFGPAIGVNNTFVGRFAGNFTTTGDGNTAVGSGALANNTKGVANTAMGGLALDANDSGSHNTAYGYAALTNSSADINGNNGSWNTAIGDFSLGRNQSGNLNTAIGFNSGTTGDQSNITTGSNNTFLGPNSSILTGTLNNATAIGANAEVDASNAMVLGSISGVNSATSSVNVGIGTTTPVTALHVSGVGDTEVSVESKAVGGRRWTMQSSATVGLAGVFQIIDRSVGMSRLSVDTAGNVGVGTTAPDMTLSVNGNADKAGGGSWATFSDGRLKDLHGSFESGLRQVLQLHPVRYQYKEENGLGIHDSEEHVGLVAQEVQRVIPEAVTENNKGYLLVNNDPILWSMLNAIKEQQREIERLSGEVRKLRKAQRGMTQLQARLESQQRSAPAVVSAQKSANRSSGSGAAQGR